MKNKQFDELMLKLEKEKWTNEDDGTIKTVKDSGVRLSRIVSGWYKLSLNFETVVNVCPMFTIFTMGATRDNYRFKKLKAFYKSKIKEAKRVFESKQTNHIEKYLNNGS